MAVSRGIGQFYPAVSALHGLDPRTKILGTAALIFALFFVDTAVGLAVAGLVVVALVAASRVPLAVFGRFLRPVVFIVALTFFFQVLFLRDGATLVAWGPLEVHAGGLWRGAFLALRILLLVSLAGLLTATTAPVALADGIEDLLSPLKRFRFPAHEIAMMTTIALRFIPTLYEEAQKVMNAQAARGADFSEGGPIKRLQDDPARPHPPHRGGLPPRRRAGRGHGEPRIPRRRGPDPLPRAALRKAGRRGPDGRRRRRRGVRVAVRVSRE